MDFAYIDAVPRTIDLEVALLGPEWCSQVWLMDAHGLSPTYT